MKRVLIFSFFIPLALMLVFCNSDQSLEQETAIQEPTESASVAPDSNKQDSESTVKEEMSLKKSVLNSVIGEHKLIAIDAFTGANTMIDFAIQKGKWLASGSSISDGMREGFDIVYQKMSYQVYKQ